jgi:hypothetical protein
MSYNSDAELIGELEAKVEELENELNDISQKYGELLAFVSNFRILASSFSEELTEDIEIVENDMLAEHEDENSFKNKMD